LKELIEQIAKAASILPARERGACRIWFTWKGKPVFISAGSRKPKEARENMRAKIGAWLAKLPQDAPQAIVTPHPMKAEVARYLKLEHEHSKAGTLTEATRTLNKLGKVLDWPDCSALTKALYREKYPAIREPLAAKSWANELAEHRRFSKWLVREEIILRDFTDGVKRPKRSSFGTREAIYREAWFQPLWDELPHEWREPWEDHWFTGMDTKDIWEFEPLRHLLPVGNTLKIWKQRAKETEMIDQPLNSRIKARWVARLASCKPGDRLHENAKRYASEKSWGNQFRRALHAAQKRLGLPQLDLKSTRHTFTTRHLLRQIRGEKNAPTVEEVQRWLGHAKGSAEIHRVYAKLLSNPHLMD
jgi:integrase